MSVNPFAQNEHEEANLVDLFSTLYKPHPWHGVSPGTPDELPDTVQCYIESVPGDAVKYEVHKPSGYLMVDRPHKFSSMCPTLYGFVPQTYCGERVAQRAMQQNPSLTGIRGDGDPLDICVLSSRPVTHGDILVRCRPVGGLRMIDGGEADDKLVAVIEGDPAWGTLRELSELPTPMVDLIRHYFLTYKEKPDHEKGRSAAVSIPEVYGADEAKAVLSLSIDDYVDKYGKVKHKFFAAFAQMLQGAMAASEPSRAVCGGLGCGVDPSVPGVVRTVSADSGSAASGPGAAAGHPAPPSLPTANPSYMLGHTLSAAGSAVGGDMRTKMRGSQHLASYYYAQAKSPNAAAMGLTEPTSFSSTTTQPNATPNPAPTPKA